MTRRTILEVVEGAYTGRAVWTLCRLGAFERLESGVGTAELARELGCDEGVLAAILEYVFHTTDLLTRETGRYTLAHGYDGDGRLAFQLEKFLGAYGSCVEQMAMVARDPSLGATLRDETALARAFAAVNAPRPSLPRRLLNAWEVTSLFDLGCGTAALLIELAQADTRFRGWGIDAGPEMVLTAKRTIRDAGVEQRVEVWQSDVRALDERIVAAVRDQVDVIYGRSLLNEFFAGDGAAATAVLRALREWFPGRLLFVEDYYGCLTRAVDSVEHRHHTLVQDFAQVLSGQGVPPSDLSGWQHVYESAGCSLVKAYEGDNDGVGWFIHVVEL